MSNASRSKGCRAGHHADLVASLRLRFSPTSVLKGFVQSTVFRAMRSFSSIVDVGQSAGKALALSSTKTIPCDRLSLDGFQIAQ